VIVQGDVGDKFYIIKEGEAQVGAGIEKSCDKLSESQPAAGSHPREHRSAHGRAQERAWLVRMHARRHLWRFLHRPLALHRSSKAIGR
jgi:hypothetical protein